jgi:hypothetical protein
MDKIYQGILDDICDKLESEVGLNAFGGDLHHELCNVDYFIIGRYEAKQFLGDNAFEAIETIKNYEQSNFGEVSTDFSEPERVVNMLAYIVGEWILAESDHLQESYDRLLNKVDLKEILSEIGGINTLKLYNEAA